MSISTRWRIGIASFAVATATVAFAAPASASVDSLSVSASTVNINQSYTITAKVSGASLGLLVYFSDNGQKLSPTAGKVPWPVGQATTSWTPTTPGTHTLTASQGSTSQSITVTVVDPSATTTTTTPPPPPPPPTTTSTPPPPTGSCS